MIMEDKKQERKPDPKPWRTLSSEYISRRPWLTARRDTVQLPSGVINKEYWILEFPDWINVIAHTVDDRFVFIRQYRHGLGRTCPEIVAGVIDPTDASPLDAARRELSEESGYGGGTWRELMTISCNPSNMTNLVHCFVAEGVEPQGNAHLEATEDIVVDLLTREEVLNLLHGDSIKQALMLAPLWRYFYGEKG